MARPKKKPEYDSEKIMKEMMAAVVDSYEETGELKLTAEEFGMSALKIRKLLITAGAYSNDISDEVNRLYGMGMTVAENRAWEVIRQWVSARFREEGKSGGEQAQERKKEEAVRGTSAKLRTYRNRIWKNKCLAITIE